MAETRTRSAAHATPRVSIRHLFVFVSKNERKTIQISGVAVQNARNRDRDIKGSRLDLSVVMVLSSPLQGVCSLKLTQAYAAGESLICV